MDAEQIAEAKNAAVMPRRVDTISEAQTVIAQLVQQKNTFTNKATGISVIISGKTIKKLGFLKDKERVYPPVIHAQAVANIDRLFENAQIHATHKDRYPNRNIKQIHRFGTVMEYDGEYYPLIITVKEYLGNKKQKLYSVEAVELKEIKKSAARPPADKSERNGPAPDFYKSLADLIESVKASSTPHSLNILSPDSAETSSPENDSGLLFQLAREGDLNAGAARATAEKSGQRE
ncbi:MAG: hypothetical protein LBK66_11450 [Spirochaetaceae bacterium]|jgi:hypothetical protein|nr:hypothetical protein [Spirochaetaceae bacterium]